MPSLRPPGDGARMPEPRPGVERREDLDFLGGDAPRGAMSRMLVPSKWVRGIPSGADIGNPECVAIGMLPGVLMGIWSGAPIIRPGAAIGYWEIPPEGGGGGGGGGGGWNPPPKKPFVGYGISSSSLSFFVLLLDAWPGSIVWIEYEGPATLAYLSLAFFFFFCSSNPITGVVVCKMGGADWITGSVVYRMDSG
jgi:hypothetical protein